MVQNAMKFSRALSDRNSLVSSLSPAIRWVDSEKDPIKQGRDPFDRSKRSQDAGGSEHRALEASQEAAIPCTLLPTDCGPNKQMPTTKAGARTPHSRQCLTSSLAVDNAERGTSPLRTKPLGGAYSVPHTRPPLCRTVSQAASNFIVLSRFSVECAQRAGDPAPCEGSDSQVIKPSKDRQRDSREKVERAHDIKEREYDQRFLPSRYTGLEKKTYNLIERTA